MAVNSFLKHPGTLCPMLALLDKRDRLYDERNSVFFQASCKWISCRNGTHRRTAVYFPHPSSPIPASL